MKIWDIVKSDFEQQDNLNEDWKKNIAATAIAASTLFGAKAQDSTKNLGEPTRIETTSNAVSMTIMQQWNDYVKWLKDHNLSGSKKMNNIAFSKQTLIDYNNEHPNSMLTYSHVKPIQSQIKNFRKRAINLVKSGKSTKFNFTPNQDYSNFMSWVVKTPEDGINGEFTSQFIFPKSYLIDLNTHTTTDLGLQR